MLSDKCELIDDSLQHDTNKIQQPLQFVDLLLRIREIVSMVAIKTGVLDFNIRVMETQLVARNADLSYLTGHYT